MNFLTLVLIILTIISSINLILLLTRKNNSAPNRQLKELEEKINSFYIILDKTNKDIREEFKSNRAELNDQSRKNREEQARSLDSFKLGFKSGFKDFNDGVRYNFEIFAKRQLEIGDTIEKHLKSLREENTLQITEMRKTVDEKLQTTLEKRISESFRQVSQRLEMVHKGLGEMQTIATGVGDLKKVLSNVKTRGVLGEYQLGNILEEILSPSQFSKNVATKVGREGSVEYAVKLPGSNKDSNIWLPIDSKFPIENYQRLIDAYDIGEKNIIDGYIRDLLKNIDSFARDISDKYIDPPNTTDFAIMFLPIEGLYAEVLRHPGVVESLQKKYKITITGPTTLSALLNSLNMGFRTLAVQRKSSEVWKVLESVKTEFVNFEEQLDRVYKQLNTATSSLDVLKSTRTTAMLRKLKDVGTLE